MCGGQPAAILRMILLIQWLQRQGNRGVRVWLVNGWEVGMIFQVARHGQVNLNVDIGASGVEIGNQ